MGDFVLLFQKRHLLIHANGVVDSDYVQKSGDREYALGQRIVIRETHVLRLLTLVDKLGSELKKLAP